MGYPQPDSDQAVLAGADVFRLHTTIVTPGDTYDSKQTGFGFAIGPDSDIAQVFINYFDPSAPNNMNQVAIGPGTPFVGKIEAFNDPAHVYQPQGVPGRIIFTLGDILPLNTQFGRGGTGYPGSTSVVAPVLDIIQYFGQPPAGIGALRADRTYRFIVEPTSDTTLQKRIIALPYYGRKYASISASALAGAGGVSTMKLEGWRYYPGDGTFATGSPGADVTTLLTATSYAGASSPLNHVVKASSDGTFDYIAITIDSTGEFTEIAVQFSDVEA